MIRRRALLAASAALPLAARAQTPAAPQMPTPQMPAPQMPASGRKEWAAQVPQIRIGVLGGENEADRLGRYDAYQKLIESTFGVPVRMFFASDYGGVQQAFGARSLEIATMAPIAYAATWMDTNGAVEPILVTKEADGTTSYVALMYVRADSGITAIEGLRGKSMAWSDPNSASGYVIPRAELRASGINPESFFGRTGFAGGHEQALVAVLQRQYDAGVCWSSGQGDEAKGFTRGVLTSAVDKGLLNMRDLRIIWRSRPIQNGPIVVRTELPASFKKDMVDFHLALPTTHPDIHRAVERGSAIGWAPTKHEDYAVFVDMRRAEAAERRRRN